MSEVLIREAVPSDRDAVVRIARTIWEGADYVPYEWNGWLAEPFGRVFVAERGGEVVGFHHLAIHPDGSGWLEGIRVDEAARGEGVGARLLQAAVEWAGAHRVPALRMAVSSDNEASIRLSRKAGFLEVAQFNGLDGSPGEETSLEGPVRVAAVSELEEVQARIEVLTEGRPAAGFYTEGWTVYRLSRQRLALLLAMHAVVVAGDGVEALAIATARVVRPTVRLGLLVGSPRGVGAICRYLRACIHASGFARVRAVIAADIGTMEAMQEAGFEGPKPHRMLLFERVVRG